MIYHLFRELTGVVSGFNVFHYISFRTFVATLTAFGICFILGPTFISFLQRLHMGQVVRDDGPKSHRIKSGIPTMGGALILFSIFLSTLFWLDLSNKNLWVVLGVALSFGLVGFADDYLKITQKSSKGLRGKVKLLIEFAIAGVVALLIETQLDVKTTLSLPFFKNAQIDIGLLFIPFCMVVIVGTANAVNFTDGLDGLALGPIMISMATYLFLTYVSGHKEIANYLQIPFVRGSGELAIFCGIVIGAGLGFLWYNTFPASIIMGDVGSLSLGGALGTIAVIAKHELLLLIVGGIFVLETLSVIAQVISFKITRKRVFRMAPIHHHFELNGWAEPKIIVRFWIVSILLSLIALSTLKIR